MFYYKVCNPYFFHLRWINLSWIRRRDNVCQQWNRSWECNNSSATKLSGPVKRAAYRSCVCQKIYKTYMGIENDTQNMQIQSRILWLFSSMAGHRVEALVCYCNWVSLTTGSDKFVGLYLDPTIHYQILLALVSLFVYRTTRVMQVGYLPGLSRTLTPR